MIYYNPLKRRIFFWLLTFLFFFTVPVILSYAFGYRYSPQRGVFVYGGSITLAPNPQRIDIRVNGQKPPRSKLNYLNNSYHIDGLYPGDYNVSVSQDGYSTWSKTISVHSGISTEFWNVLLTKNTYPYKDIANPNIERFFLSPKRNVIAYTSSVHDEFLIHVLDTDTQTSKQVFSSKEWRYAKDSKENIEWAPRNDALLLPLGRISQEDSKNIPQQNQYMVVFNEDGTTVDLKDIVSTQTMRSARWSPEERNVMYFIDQDVLYKLNVRDKTLLQVSDDTLAFDMDKNTLYILQKSNAMVFRKSLTGQTLAQLTTSPLFSHPLEEGTRLIAYDEDRVVALSPSGTLAIFNKAERQIYARELPYNVEDMQFSNDGKKLLFWNSREISVYFLRDWEVQPQRNENDILEIGRFFEPVKNIHWTKSYEHVIYTTKDAIKIMELDKRDRQNVATIVPVRDFENAISFSDAGGGKLYYTDLNQSNQNLSLYVIDFPEKTGFLPL